MAKVEKLDEGLKRSEWKAGTGAGTTTPPEVKKTFLESFLARLKLFAITKQQNPDFRLTEVELRDLDEKLDSPNKVEQQSAIQKVEELLKIRSVASEEVGKTTMEQVVNKAKLPATKRVDLETKAKRVDILLRTATTTPTQAQLEEVYSNLQELREGLGSENLGIFVERAEGFTYIEEQLDKLAERRKIADFGVNAAKAGEFRIDALEAQSDEFKVIPGANDLLQVRVGWQPTLKPKLEDFRRHVREELIEKTKPLTNGDDVIKRIQEVSEWRGRLHELYGDKWVGSKRQDEIRSLLLTVEAGYQEELAKKIEAEFKDRGVNGDADKYIRSALTLTLEKKRTTGKSTYELGTENFKSINDKVKNSVDDIKKRVGRDTFSPMSSRISPEMEEMYAGGQAQLSAQQRLQATMIQLDKMLIGTTYKLDSQFIADLEGKNGVAEVLNKMKKAGVDVTNPYVVNFVENARITYLEDQIGFRDMQSELTKSLAEGRYAESINITMEFISRVGLKEASSDWKLAVILRELKDKISTVNADLSEAFEARQHLRFLPSINSIMPEKFGEIASQVMAKSNVDLGLSPEMVYMMGTQIVTPDGRKMNVSTAMFKDLLRSEKNSMKLLDADVDTTDSTLRGIFVEHVWGPGAAIEADGKHILLGDKKTKVSMDKEMTMEFYDINTKHAGNGLGELDGNKKVVTVEQMLNSTQWMFQDAQQFWWYGREWEKYLANYPKEQMESAPKGLAAAGRMWGSYKSEFEQIARTMKDITILGAMLQPNEVYKLNDAVATNVREILLKEIKNDKRWTTDEAWRKEQLEIADGTGKLFALALGNRINLKADSEEYTFLLDTVSMEELRLVGNKIDTSNFNAVWAETKKRYKGLGMKDIDIPEDSKAEGFIRQWDAQKDKTKIKDKDVRFWGLQVEEMRALIDSKKFSQLQEVIKHDKDFFKGFKVEEFIKKLDANGLKDLKPLFENQERVHGKAVTAKTMSELFEKDLEFSAVLSWAKTSQGDDPFQYGAKYYQKAVEAGNLLTKICNLMGTSEDMTKLHEIMSGYVPAPELRKFQIILEHRLAQSRTNQVIPYEVVALREGADSPNAFDFVTMTDSEKRKWQVKGRYGERGTIKEQYIGNFGWKEKGMYGWRDSDVEHRTKFLNAIGYLTKEKAEEMYEQVTGVHREINWVFNKLGLKGPAAKKVAHFMGHWGSKIKGVLKKHPLFDDPVYAFWSILNEFLEFGKETGKEISKELAHG